MTEDCLWTNQYSGYEGEATGTDESATMIVIRLSKMLDL